MYKIHMPTLRVVSVLNLISSHEEGFTVSSCSRILGIPAGTLHPVLRTLHAQKYLDYDVKSCRYTAGLRLFLAGVNYVSHSKLYENLQHILKTIVESCGETVHFGVLEGANVLYLAKADSPQAVRMTSFVGKTLPAHSTALGKALLSRFEFDELRLLYPAGLEALTPYTVTDVNVLYKQLKLVRSCGFAYECEESNESIRCIAVPVTVDKTVKGALSVAVPVYRYSDEKKVHIERCLLSAASDTGKILSYLNI